MGSHAFNKRYNCDDRTLAPIILNTFVMPTQIEYCSQQDRVPEFASEEARGILERELGTRVSSVFQDGRSFKTPIAAASLGQV